MLATLVDKPFDDPGWVYEVKWDGYRALGFCLKNGDVQILSRNNKQFNEKFYPIFQVLQTWKKDIVLDGEILVINQKGVSKFGDLQNWRSEADGDLVYYVFDLIWYEGKDFTELPLAERQAILEAAQLSGRDIEILCGNGDGTRVARHRISSLIPNGFGPANLADSA